jgi:hypothetical protein
MLVSNVAVMATCLIFKDKFRRTFFYISKTETFFTEKQKQSKKNHF